jgi:hypothetical protein
MTSVRPITQNNVKGKWSSSDRETHTRSSKQGSGVMRLLAVWRAFCDSFAPLGYEDETGFHYGDRPERN